MLVLAGCCGGIWLGSVAASAQGRGVPLAVAVASQLWLKPGVERPIEIRLVPIEAVPPQSVVVIRGVPAGMRFSEGRPFGEGVWVIPAARLPDLKVQTPGNVNSGGLLTIALTTLEGVAMAQAQVTVLSVPETKETAETSALRVERDIPVRLPPWTPEQNALPPAPKPVENRAELLLLLEKGKESMRLGNILHARQFYERAANTGLAEAAFALATTYDPRELPRMKGIAGVTPDPELARKWYQKASELGSPDASALLSDLGRR
jgi:Sel1 repeat